jgi:hypothetical protein
LTDAEIARIRLGQAIAKQLPHEGVLEVAAVSADGQLAAILAPRGKDLWGPECNLPMEDSR